MVAETMLTDSQAFLTELCNWVSRHHFELLTRTESDEGTVWKLVAYDVRVIFQLLFEARGPGRNTGEPQHFFWGTLRAHKVMQELRAHKLSGHPQLGHALNQHLQDNAVMKSSFNALFKQVESLKKEVSAAMKTAEKAVSKKKGKFRIGVVAKGTPFWEWLTPRLGTHSWTWNSGDKKKTLRDMLQEDPVDVVLFDKIAPSTSSPVWNDPNVKFVMWEVWGSLDVGLVEDKGWTLGNAAYNHEKLGGLTNLTSTSRMAWRKEFYDRNQAFSPDPTVTGTLHRVIDPTVSGRQVDPPFDRTELQVAGGLLDWKRRSEEVVVPTVFSKSKWVKRRLLPKELGSALDIPSDVISLGERSGKLKRWCREVRVPFKTRLRAVLEGLSKVIVEDSDWNVNGDLRRKAGQSKLSETPRAKRQKSGENTVELQLNSPAEQVRPHDSTASDTIEETPNIEKTHVRSKAWYVEDSGAADEAKEKKATKADDAEVPVDLWDDRIVHRVFGVNVSLARKEEITNGLNTIRKFALKFWRLKVARDFRTWWIDYAEKEKKHGRVPRRELLDAGVEALRYAAGALWWQWDSGSAPFFWRWEEEFLEDLATGYKPMFKEIPKPSTASVRLTQDKEMRKMMRKKLEKVIRQTYIDVSEEEILAVIQYFAVEKGLYDIRMVYDGTKSELNNCLFPPWFALPTMTTMFRGLDVDFWCADNDFSDNFLNYLINKELRAYCGIDVDVLMEGEVGYVKCSYTWTRCAMGLKPSPYFACQQNIRAKRYMLGNPEDDDNVFNWDDVIVNLPGNGKYDPSMPLIYKVRKDGTIAADIVCYVDDNRVTAGSEEDAWSVKILES
eukprot:scaffold20529_cov53-Attheya_sp.AAC.4